MDACAWQNKDIVVLYYWKVTSSDFMNAKCKRKECEQSANKEVLAGEDH